MEFCELHRALDTRLHVTALSSNWMVTAALWTLPGTGHTSARLGTHERTARETIDEDFVVIRVNEVLLNAACLHKNLNINFNCLLNNLGTIRIYRQYQEKSERRVI